MTERQRADEIKETNRSLKRRGILAAAGAAVAGIVAKQTSQPVAAAASMQYADTSTPVNNNALGQTNLFAALAVDRVALNVVASSSADTFDAIGVLGEGSHLGPGVMGLMDGVAFPAPSLGAGVYGGAQPGRSGVSGLSSTNGNGVLGCVMALRAWAARTGSGVRATSVSGL